MVEKSQNGPIAVATTTNPGLIPLFCHISSDKTKDSIRAAYSKIKAN
jgi:hypothetical protein